MLGSIHRYSDDDISILFFTLFIYLFRFGGTQGTFWISAIISGSVKGPYIALGIKL